LSLYNTNNTSSSCTDCQNQNCLIKNNIFNFSNSNLTDNKNTLKLKKGQQFIIEGTPVNGLFFILTGTVKVFRTNYWS